MSEVKLSDGTVVTFKGYNHKADRVLSEEMNRGVVLKDGQKLEIPVNNIQRAYEAVLPHIIVNPTVTQDWLDGLSREDYSLLYDEAVKLYTTVQDEKERGKKS